MVKSKARQKLDRGRDLILWLFDRRCVRCGRPSTTIHEIVPISHGKNTLMIKNRVILCQISEPNRQSCHDWAHNIGTTNSIPILEELRKKYLIRKFGLEINGGL